MRAPATTFRDLIVWQKAHAFVLEVYKLTHEFPKHETFGLSSQLRRAAVSIPANVAEGFTRISKAEKARFFNIAAGSLEECRYYLILAHDLKCGDTKGPQQDVDDVGRVLNAYGSKIRGMVG